MSGCAVGRESGGPSEPAAETGTVAPTTASSQAACPSPHGGVCLGLLAAGTYRTRAFERGLSYTVPDGWSNLEDLPGQVLLLPPGRSVDGVDAGTADYLGVYDGVAVAAADCSPRPEPGVGSGAEGVATALRERPGLEVSPAQEVTVGGLRGLVVDISLVEGTRAGCVVEGGLRIVPLVIGTGPAEFEHAALAGGTTRLYLLEDGKSLVAVEVNEVSADGPFPDLEAVVGGLRFSP